MRTFLKVRGFCLSLVGVSACFFADIVGTKTQGRLLLNGASFEPTWCYSGEVYQFHGVDLVNQVGERIRIAIDVDGSTRVVYFPANASRGTTLVDCADVRMEPTNTRINGYRKWEGRARIACQSDPVQVAGEFSFTCSAP